MLPRILLVGFAMMVLTGCATTKGQSLGSETQMRIGELERQIDSKDEEISSLKDEVRQLSVEVDHIKGGGSDFSGSKSSRATSSGKMTDAEVKAAAEETIHVEGVSAAAVQKALKKAGYYNGTVDGKIGAQTKAAISKFQKDKGLKADGVIGKKTWEELNGKD